MYGKKYKILRLQNQHFMKQYRDQTKALNTEYAIMSVCIASCNTHSDILENINIKTW